MAGLPSPCFEGGGGPETLKSTRIAMPVGTHSNRAHDTSRGVSHTADVRTPLRSEPWNVEWDPGWSLPAWVLLATVCVHQGWDTRLFRLNARVGVVAVVLECVCGVERMAYPRLSPGVGNLVFLPLLLVPKVQDAHDVILRLLQLGNVVEDLDIKIRQREAWRGVNKEVD